MKKKNDMEIKIKLCWQSCRKRDLGTGSPAPNRSRETRFQIQSEKRLCNIPTGNFQVIFLVLMRVALAGNKF